MKKLKIKNWTKTDDKQEGEDEKITESEFKIDKTQNSQSRQSSWWSSYSSLSSQYSSQTRELSDDEDDEDDEKWWQSFCNSPDKKEKEKEEPMEILTQTAVDKDDNKKVIIKKMMMTKTMMKEKLNFLEEQEKIKDLNTINLFVQMANIVNRNKFLNIIYKQGIEYNKSNIQKIEKEIGKKDYVYLKICDLTDSARIIQVTNKLFIVEFDLEENKKLAKYLNNLFFIKRIGQRRVQKKKKKKIGHGYVTENLFVTYKIMK